jgi:EAL domain-containing protein (putative c-di-GMP-specific phosphodiesterase class I)/tetratricopeptide (TPR) repeat protein
MERALCPVVVGREEQLAVLEDHLLSARRGSGQLVAIGGEAGFGKTRLVTELRRRASLHSMQALGGGCSEADLALPYLPLVEAAGEYIGRCDPAALRTALGPAYQELAQVFPQIGRPSTRPADNPAGARVRLFESLLEVFLAAARPSGLLLVVEDLQWADSSTRELVDFLARRIQGTSIMLLVTYRTDEMHRRHPLMPTMQAWRRAGLVDVLDLRPLTPEQVGAMAAAILGTGQLGKELRDLLWERAEGNPFVVEEILKENMDEGVFYREDGGWASRVTAEMRLPRSVADAILMRVTRLTPQEADILQAAAVLGRSFLPDDLATVSGEEAGTISEVMKTCVQQQLLDHDEDGRRFQFRHSLTLEAVYEDMILPRRQQLHLLAARALQERPSSSPAEIANHLVQAGRWDEAIPACLSAAEMALLGRAYKAAASLYERVLPHVVDPAEHARLLCELGNAHWNAGDPATAQKYLDDGIAALESQGSALSAAHHRLASARCSWERSRLDEARRQYQHCRAVLEEVGPSEDLALAYCGLAGLCAFELDGPGAQELAERAAAIASQVEAPSAHVRALSFLGIGMVYQGEIEAGLRHMDEAYAVARREDMEWNAITCLYNAIVIRIWHLRAQDCVALVDELGSLPGGWWRQLAFWRARALTCHELGELAAALAAAEEVGALARQGGADMLVSWAARMLAKVLVEMGRVDEAREALPSDTAGTDRQEQLFDCEVRSRILLASGDAAGAARVAAPVLDVEDLAQDYLVLSSAVEALTAGGRVDDASTLLEQSVARGLQRENPYVLASLGRMALAQGDVPAAVAHLESAVEAFSVAGYRLEHQRLLVQLARGRWALGEASAAAEHLSAAVTSARDCEAGLNEAEARSVAEEMHLAIAEAPPAARARRRSRGEEAADEAPGRMSIVGQLRRAIRQHHFLMYYQPKCRLGDGALDSIESLLRWKHPQMGMISPERFVPIAEQVGLIRTLTLTALDNAFRQCQAWHVLGLEVTVTVNISVLDVEDPRFADSVAETLQVTGLSPEYVGLEITEGGVMSNPARSLETLGQLKSLGVQLSIDDFGIGQSSLSHLRNLPVDEIKLDRTFAMEWDDRNAVIIRTAATMGHDLGLKVTCEGIESREMAERLAALGCEVGQGDYFGEPAPPEQAERRLRELILS